jgi:O-antigen/teichoic acid export membrane protein
MRQVTAEQRVIRNAGVAVLQVVVSGVVLYALFFFLLRTVGPSQLGVWSVVLAATSAARLTELGLSGGVVKFVATYLAREDREKAGAVLETGALSIAILIASMGLLAFPFVKWLLGYILPLTSLPAGLAVLPFAFLSLWSTAVASVFLAGLDGAGRTDLRSIVMICGPILNFALVLILIPTHGLMGVAYAQVIQAIFTLVISWILLRRMLPGTLSILPCRWNADVFREMLRYGGSFQVASLTQMMFDPMTKAFLSKFGGLDMVSYYEMASKMIMQFRSLLISANQVIVPFIAGMQELTPSRIPTIYRESYQLILYLALPLFAGIAAISPIVGELWIGRHELAFVFFSLLLSCGWFLNTLVAPAYFSYLGTGRLRWNTASHLLTGLLNGATGAILGASFGGYGVVFGLLVALVLGSVVVVIGFHIENKIPFRDLFSVEFLPVAIACVVALCLSWAIYFALQGSLHIAFIAATTLIVYIAVVAPFMWRHELRSKVQVLVFRKKNRRM